MRGWNYMTQCGARFARPITLTIPCFVAASFCQYSTKKQHKGLLEAYFITKYTLI